MRKSPFPGMDPYLQRRWGDVHTRLCTSISAALQTRLPNGLRARAQEDVLLENDDEDSVYFEPDITIVETEIGPGSFSTAIATATIDPVLVRHVPMHKTRRWIEILDTADGNRLVTAIEILSPGNKASGLLNQKYLKKLEQYLDGGVNVVEIDLLRSSRARLPVPTSQIPEHRRATYYVSICRAKDTSLWKVYPMPLRNVLPAVPIPCRETDNDVLLELQPVIDRIYLEGGHDDLKYHEPLEPPLSKEDTDWAAGLIANRKAGS